MIEASCYRSMLARKTVPPNFVPHKGLHETQLGAGLPHGFPLDLDPFGLFVGLMTAATIAVAMRPSKSISIFRGHDAGLADAGARADR
jgi:hypothetical protein